jgi:hypothetical protein
MNVFIYISIAADSANLFSAISDIWFTITMNVFIKADGFSRNVKINYVKKSHGRNLLACAANLCCQLVLLSCASNLCCRMSLGRRETPPNTRQRSLTHSWPCSGLTSDQ